MNLYLTLFQLLEEEIFIFVKDEMTWLRKVLLLDDPESLEGQSDNEEQRGSREAFLKITLDFLRRMKLEELADCLQSSKGLQQRP